jgi:hypothetical protein
MSLSTMRNNILKFCPGLSPDLINSTLQDSYRQLCLLDWNRLNITRQISTVAPYSTGHITITSGGIVTGSGVTFTSAFVGRQLRCYYSDSFFEILSVPSSSTLTLRGWPGDTLSTPQLYTIFSNIYSVDTSMKVLFDVAYQTSLDKKSQDFFNRRDPERSTTGSPVWWAYAGFNPLGYPLIEVYPVPDQVYPLRIYGKVSASTLANTDTPYLSEDLIEAHALISCFRIKQTMEPKSGWEQRLVVHAEVYKTLFESARDEDFQLGSHRTKVKDYMDNLDLYPASDSFWTQHDVE